jgi:hypothetical protein
MGKNPVSNFEQYSSIIGTCRSRFETLIVELKKRPELGQSLEFSVSKVEAELLSLESSLKEIDDPSDAAFSAHKKAVLLASVGKLLPYFLVNFERLGLQCGVDNPGGDPAQIRELFEKNPEFTELLLSKAQ